MLNNFSSGWNKQFLPSKDFYGENNYAQIPGFYSVDYVIGYEINNLYIFLQVLNATNEIYGGLDATGYDIDLRFNQQLGSNMRIGLNFKFN